MLLRSGSMWKISAVPLYLWCMLLLPSVVVAIYVGVRRKWVCAPVPVFSLAAALSHL
jgi:hypothetical protein